MQRQHDGAQWTGQIPRTPAQSRTALGPFDEALPTYTNMFVSSVCVCKQTDTTVIALLRYDSFFKT